MLKNKPSKEQILDDILLIDRVLFKEPNKNYDKKSKY
jgi:hypothetical protein